ncbi:MAG: S8 family serine peptidase [Chloroflexota bacterium]
MKSKFKKYLSIGTLLCLLIFVLAACGGEDEPEAPEADSSSGEFQEASGEIDTDVGPPATGDDVEEEQGGRSSAENPDPEIIGDMSESEAQLGSLFESAKSLDELVEQYPELSEIMTNLDLNDRENLSKVYEKMMNLYNEEGILGMQTFLDESGISASLGLDATYIDFVIAYENEGWAGAEDLARRRKLITQNDELRMILVLDEQSSSDAEAGAEALGVNVLRTGDFEIEIGVPLELLRDAENSEEAMAQLVALTRLPNVARIRVPKVAVTSQSDILAGEGPETTLAVDAHEAGITGDGIKVGVIDPDGFFAFQDLQGLRLPEGDQLVVMPGQDPDYLNDNTGGHGTACAEIVHEMAPDATIYIAQAQSGLELVEAVEWMLEEGVQIINYSAGNISVPPNNSTPFSQLVDEVVDEGVLWVNSSGNFAQSHLYMEFTDEDGNGVHEFPNGEEYLQIRPLEGAPAISLGLSWPENWGRAENDFDLYLLQENAAGDDLEIVDSSRELQDGNRGSFPSETIDAYVDDQIYYVAIVADGGEVGTMMNLIGYASEFRYSMPEYSVTSPGDSPAALTVGATFWSDDALEPYSSQGPTLDELDKPEISAPAGVSSTVYQGPFFGTSASAPHVAGAAALVMQANPDMSVDEVRNYLISTAVDLGPRGYDLAFGFGRVDMETLAEGGPPPPPQMSNDSGDSAIQIFYVYDEHNVKQGGATGMMVETAIFVIEDNGNQEGTLTVSIEDDSGSELYSADNEWEVNAGDIFVEPIQTFISYDDLRLPNGRHDMTYSVTLYDASGSAIAESDTVGFFVEVEGKSGADNSTAGNGTADVYNVQVFQDVQVKGVDGIGISMDIDVVDRAGKETYALVFFHQDSSREPSLKDFNDEYATVGGDVATWTSFTPDSNDESWEVKVFIPNEELHLADDTRYSLKAAVVVYGEPDWDVDLAVSDWVKFRVDTGNW